MTSIKVKNIEPYDNTIICKGKLVFVKGKTFQRDKLRHGKSEEFSEYNTKCSEFMFYDNVSPIIISETEEIEVGDSVLAGTEIILADTKTKVDFLKLGNHKKILTFPKHFSPKHLQAIVDGKLKDGDEVFIECIQTNIFIDGEEPEYEVKCNPSTDNHIKLYPIDKEEIKQIVNPKYSNNIDYKDLQLFEKMISEMTKIFKKKKYQNLLEKYGHLSNARECADMNIHFGMKKRDYIITPSLMSEENQKKIENLLKDK